MGDVDCPSVKRKQSRQTETEPLAGKETFGLLSLCVFKAWLRCPMVRKKRPPEDWSSRGDAPSAHRRPGYSLSGCTPAEPDSASPGAGSIAELQDRAQRQRQPAGSPDGPGVSNAQRGSPRKDASVAQWVRTPLKKSKKDFGRPRRKYVDFFLLIGALRLRVLHPPTPPPT